MFRCFICWLHKSIHERIISSVQEIQILSLNLKSREFFSSMFQINDLRFCLSLLNCSDSTSIVRWALLCWTFNFNIRNTFNIDYYVKHWYYSIIFKDLNSADLKLQVWLRKFCQIMNVWSSVVIEKLLLCEKFDCSTHRNIFNLDC